MEVVIVLRTFPLLMGHALTSFCCLLFYSFFYYFMVCAIFNLKLAQLLLQFITDYSCTATAELFLSFKRKITNGGGGLLLLLL